MDGEADGVDEAHELAASCNVQKESDKITRREREASGTSKMRGLGGKRGRELDAAIEIKKMNRDLSMDCAGGPADAVSWKPRGTVADTSFNHRYLTDVTRRWYKDVPDMIKVIEPLNLGSIHKLDTMGLVLRDFGMYLLKHLDPETMDLDVGGGDKIKIDEDLICSIAG